MMQLVRRVCNNGAPLLLRKRWFGSQLVAPAGVLMSTEELPPLPDGWHDNLYGRLHLLPSEPAAADVAAHVIRTRVVNAWPLLIPEHPRENRHHQPPQQPARRRVDHPRRPRHVLPPVIRVLVVMASIRSGLRVLLFLVRSGRRGLGRRRAARYLVVRAGLLGAVAAAAVERHQRVMVEGGLADGALLRGGAVCLLQPPVDAWPAVEVAAESDDRLHREVQAYVAVEARGGGGLRARVRLALVPRLLTATAFRRRGWRFGSPVGVHVASVGWIEQRTSSSNKTKL
ncbi:hypothetical protein BHM03_00026680 [Ensete ventricosum]|nr:hypothetical protein BHM03_00026680 [Ensete ventricosum]